MWIDHNSWYSIIEVDFPWNNKLSFLLMKKLNIGSLTEDKVFVTLLDVNLLIFLERDRKTPKRVLLRWSDNKYKGFEWFEENKIIV